MKTAFVELCWTKSMSTFVRARSAASWLVVVSASSWATTALAQGNPQGAALGGRSTLLGGTGVALGGDSAAALLNPATIAFINQNALALSSQLIEVRYRRVEDFRQPAPPTGEDAAAKTIEDASVTRFGVHVIPLAVCYFQSIGRADPNRRSASHTGSFCIATTEHDDFKTLADSASAGNDQVRVDLASSVQAFWERLDFALSWGHFFTNELALGISGIVQESYGYQVVSTGSLIEDIEAGQAGVSALANSRVSDAWSIRAEVGLVYQPNPSVSMGLSLRLPAWVVASSYDAVRAIGTLDGETWRAVDLGSFHAPTPIRIATGLAYESERVSLELDLFFYPGMNDVFRVQGERQGAVIAQDGSISRRTQILDLSEDSSFTVNAGVGLEYRFNPAWSLLTGLQTDLSILEPVGSDPTEGLTSRRKNGYYGSIGAGYSGSFGEFVLGTRLAYSVGESWAVNSLTTVPQVFLAEDHEISALFILYGVIDFGAVAEKISPKLLQDEVEAKPPLDPTNAEVE